MNSSLKKQAIDSLKSREKEIIEISDILWEYAEPYFEEYKSADTLCRFLEKEGFEVKRGVAGMPTAFYASYGSGHPVIGILGEYDALPGMSQAAGEITQQSANGAAGHACGHNHIAASTVGGALIAKHYLENANAPGTILYFGCPAEESGSGKTFMVRDGLFKDVDIVISDHSENTNCVRTGSTSGLMELEYTFHGIKSHPAGSPEAGRSAFDAIEIFNICINYLREHIPQRCYIHYAVTYAGGSAPNIIPDLAKGTYVIRATSLAAAKDIARRVDLCAQGAAMMTETSYDKLFIRAGNSMISNEEVELTLQRNFEQEKLPEYTQEEQEFGWKLFNSNPNFAAMYDDPAGRISEKWQSILNKWQREHPQEVYNNILLPHDHNTINAPGVTDLGDVSWVCPTASIFFVAAPKKIPCHSWQFTAGGKSSVAHKGLLMAARVLGASAIDYLSDPKLVKKAQDTFKETLPGEYISPISDEIKPDLPEFRMLRK